MVNRKKVYVWTYNMINSYVYDSKEACLKDYEKYKQHLMKLINEHDYEKIGWSRECDCFGIFEIRKGSNTLSTVWCETYIDYKADDNVKDNFKVIV